MAPHRVDGDRAVLRIHIFQRQRAAWLDSTATQQSSGVTRSFDLLVVGSGTAGNTVATRCRAAGWTVAVIDKNPFGGTCALRGCDPKKVLVGAAAAVDAVHALS